MVHQAPAKRCLSVPSEFGMEVKTSPKVGPEKTLEGQK